MAADRDAMLAAHKLVCPIDLSAAGDAEFNVFRQTPAVERGEIAEAVVSGANVPTSEPHCACAT